ncbi:choline-sulfatase [Hypericibacter terrae]|uniref:Choline-sulfatase n=1 Tax=Hypericibacter terrae TaxID=2602015 RepID=A0A5J6MNE7_9PROT|nr:choline-sulfatase [Hypericibacter terrae]QEX18707.1 choline-sulfatase [Hypericibacter terrae]
MAKRKPNILFLQADQMAASFLPAYGHKVVKAPNISGLAERGVLFENFYTNSPLCAPSRFSMMAGALPSRIGAYDNAADFAADIPTFAHYLRRAGYRTALSGKMHFCGPDQLHGFEERLTTDIYPADYGWFPDWEDFETRPSWYHNMLSVIQAGPCTRSNQLDFDEETVYAARRYIHDAARGTDERPFCLVVSMTHPHDPYAILPEHWNRYRDEDIDMPAVRAGDVPLDPHARRLRHVSDMDRYEMTEAHVRAARRAYYGSIAFVDDQVGRLLQALDEVGLGEETIVLLTADHGDMLGERGLWYKMNWYENACRIPLIVAGAGGFRPHRVREATSLADLLPTLAEIAHDGQRPDYAAPIDGRSLLPHLSGTGGHDEVIGEYLGEGAIAPLTMIRRGSEKFVTTPSDPDQLFDLASDRQERRNLAADPAWAGKLAAYRAEAAKRWDMARLREDVVASQRRRRMVAAALMTGKHTSWDFQPMRDASVSYMRNHLKLDDLEYRSRLPHVETPPERR